METALKEKRKQMMLRIMNPVDSLPEIIWVPLTVKNQVSEFKNYEDT